MGRAPCCSKVGLNRGAWSAEEDSLLVKYIESHGEGQWRSLPKKAGLRRCGKSCRLRWLNYLRPCIKRGNITPDEEELIIRMHALVGNRWSIIAGRIPGRTDNEIKNYWNTHLSKKMASKGIDGKTQGSSSSFKQELIVPNVHNLKAHHRLHESYTQQECRLSTPGLAEANASQTGNDVMEIIDDTNSSRDEDHVSNKYGRSDVGERDEQKNDEFGDLFGCFYDVGKAENEIYCSKMVVDGWLQVNEESIKYHHEELHWPDDGVLKQLEADRANLESCNTYYCVDLCEPSLWC